MASGRIRPPDYQHFLAISVYEIPICFHFRRAELIVLAAAQIHKGGVIGTEIQSRGLSGGVVRIGMVDNAIIVKTVRKLLTQHGMSNAELLIISFKHRLRTDEERAVGAEKRIGRQRAGSFQGKRRH